VSDDVDSMSKEYEHWRKEAIECSSNLVEQQKITEEVLNPLMHQLAELEEKIREQQSKVTTVRSSIMRNDITVQNLLYSVIRSE
jgi:DNA-binding protein H-NS